MNNPQKIDFSIIEQCNIEQIPNYYFHNKEFVMHLLKEYDELYNVWSFLPKKFQKDLKIIELALFKDHIRLNAIDPKHTIFQNISLQKKAVVHNPYNLEFVSQAVLEDTAWLKQIITDEGLAFGSLCRNKNADQDYTKNAELARLASETYSETFILLHESVINDINNIDIIKNCVTEQTHFYTFLPKNIQTNKELISYIIHESEKLSGFAKYLPSEYLQNELLMKALINKDGASYCFLPESLRNNIDILFSACQTEPISNLIYFIPPYLIEKISSQLNQESNLYQVLQKIHDPNRTISKISLTNYIYPEKKELLNIIEKIYLSEKLESELINKKTSHKYKL